MTRSHGLFPHFLSAAALLALAACGGPARPAQPAPAPEPAGAEQIGSAPDVPAARPAPAPVGILGTARYDLPVQANPWVATELDFLVNQRRQVIGRWLQRADYYGEWVQEVFAGHGLPRDLHHLAMVESGYQPTARSRVGALGIWQFMPATGRQMGLRIDDMVDERMDPVRSTHAAARYLKDLHRSFRGDWALAAAAYNAGGGRISRSLGRFGVGNYWDLISVGDLASETKHYVPRLYAVTIIGRDPQRFGYTAPAGPVRRFAYDSVRVDVVTPLAELARIGTLSADELRSLNPHLVTSTVPANYWVWVPAGTGQATQLAFLASDFRRDGGYGRYPVRRGDDLGKLAELTGVTVERIRELNPAVDPANLRSGQRLVLPAAAARTLAARPVERVAARQDTTAEKGDGEERTAARPSARRSRGGDTGETAERRSTASRSASTREERGEQAERSAERGKASGEEASPRRTGRPSERTAERSSERTADAERPAARRSRGGDDSEKAGTEPRPGSAARGEGESRSRPASAGSRERPAAAEAPRAARREHTVADGETLWSIARRYELSVDEVKAANELGDAPIRPGQKLRIPGTAAARSADAGEKPESRTPAARGGGESSVRGRSADAERGEAGRARSTDGDRGETRTASRDSSARGQGASRPAARRAEGERTAARPAREEARPAPTARAAARFEEHVVRDGETLWSISRRYRTSVDSIIDANGMRQGQAIQPGQKLRVPAEASTR